MLDRRALTPTPITVIMVVIALAIAAMLVIGVGRLVEPGVADTVGGDRPTPSSVEDELRYKDDYPGVSRSGSRVARIEVTQTPRGSTVGIDGRIDVLSFETAEGAGPATETVLIPKGVTLGSSADGRQLLSWGYRWGYRRPGALRADIFVVHADGSDLRWLTHDGDNRWPTWSPDGSRIAFVRNGALTTMAADRTG